MKITPAIIHRSSPRRIAVLSLALLAMAGCADSDANNPNTQVVAKVNGDEISVHQVNNAIAQIPNVTPENVEKVRGEVLDKLINQQLAIQQAEEHKIDRSTEVMMKVDAARREILTRAYLSQVVASLPKPGENEAKEFYTSHPALFAERRIYNLQEIVLEQPHPPAAQIRELIAGKSMDQIAAALKAQNISFSTNSGTRAAEQISLPVLNGLAEIQDGETKVVETSKAVLILHVAASQSAPVSEEAALQRIPQYLANEQAKEAITADLDRLKAEADIEYMNQPAAAAGSKEATAKPAKQTTAAQPAARPQSAETNADNSTEKGISGL